jgi:hypothetical protein
VTAWNDSICIKDVDEDRKANCDGERASGPRAAASKHTAAGCNTNPSFMQPRDGALEEFLVRHSQTRGHTTLVIIEVT